MKGDVVVLPVILKINTRWGNGHSHYSLQPPSSLLNKKLYFCYFQLHALLVIINVQQSQKIPSLDYCKLTMSRSKANICLLMSANLWKMQNKRLMFVVFMGDCTEGKNMMMETLLSSGQNLPIDSQMPMHQGKSLFHSMLHERHKN